MRQRLREIQAVSSVKGAAAGRFGNAAAGGSEPTSWVKGTKTPGDVTATTPGKEGNGPKGRKPPKIAVAGEPNKDGKNAVDPAGEDGNRKKPQGGFWVDFRNLGADERRSNYDPTTLAIVINLDHPVVAAALSGASVEDLAFKRLSYEIAFTEYSMALAYEMANEDPEIPADDLLFELRDSLNRVSRSAAALYR